MTNEEYDKKVQELEDQHTQAKFELRKQYVIARLKFKVGDIVKDGSHTILIESIGVTHYTGYYPSAIYKGLILKKNLEPRQDKSRGSVSDERAELVKAKTND